MIDQKQTSVASPSELAEIGNHFQLRGDVTFLNHGSYGACPRPVFEVYQRWQRELEAEPVDFLGRRRRSLLADALSALAVFLGTQSDNLVFVPNATTGINIVARSLDLQPGDEVLTTDHEYGAVDRTWRYNCDLSGARYINSRVPLPMESRDQIVEHVWSGVTDRTRVISISHVTSPTGLILPVEEICERARSAGILSVIDGAHAPGQIDLNLEQIGADFYVGNCHKWLCAPKSAGFLYARPEVQHLLKPLIVSWGWQADGGNTGNTSSFGDLFGWTGTQDPSALLSVPAAIEFQREHDWPGVRAACHKLGVEARERIAELTGLPQICPDSADWWSQMSAVPLPESIAPGLSERLWSEYRIEVPVTSWNNKPLLRISIQAYNRREDIDRLVKALARIVV